MRLVARTQVAIDALQLFATPTAVDDCFHALVAAKGGGRRKSSADSAAAAAAAAAGDRTSEQLSYDQFVRAVFGDHVTEATLTTTDNARAIKVRQSVCVCVCVFCNKFLHLHLLVRSACAGTGAAVTLTIRQLALPYLTLLHSFAGRIRPASVYVLEYLCLHVFALRNQRHHPQINVHGQVKQAQQRAAKIAAFGSKARSTESSRRTDSVVNFREKLLKHASNSQELLGV